MKLGYIYEESTKKERDKRMNWMQFDVVHVIGNGK